MSSPRAAGLDLFEALAGRRDGRDGALRSWTGSRFEVTPWSEIAAAAERKAAALVEAGAEPGRPVAAVLTNTRDAVEGVLGIWLAGGVVASLPVPARGMDLQTWGAQLAESARRLDPSAFVSEDGVVGALEPFMGEVPVRAAWSSLDRSHPVDRRPPEGDRLAFVQFSSGSTSDPKGCCLTTAAITAQLELSFDAAGCEDGAEVVSSWLPLSHDFGMFGGLLLAWAYDFDFVLSSPERFLGAPRTWFGDCADHGATITGGPPSALRYAARAARRGRLPGPLRLRACGLGAERVEWAAIEEALEAFGPSGLRIEHLQPAYGLAEATLTVTAARGGEAPHGLRVDTDALSHGEVREGDGDGTLIVTAGPPCAGVTVTCGDDEGRVGEIRVRSPSLATGYVGDPERTAERFRDGWLHTGDLGFMRDGELYVVGRLDDVINVGGRKIYAGELESVVGALDGIRSGCCTLVDVEGTPRTRLVMLAEVRSEDAGFDDLAREAALAVAAASGVTLDECVFLPKGALPKTRSGKIQRYRARRLVSDASAAVGRVALTRA